MQKLIFRLAHQVARQRAIEAIQNAPDDYIVSVQEPTRSLSQNAAQWPILLAFADQLEWPINGAMSKLEAVEWKDILTAAFRQEQPRLAQGIDGGVVMLGQRTREFTKKEFSEWIEFLHSVAVARSVKVYADSCD